MEKSQELLAVPPSGGPAVRIEGESHEERADRYERALRAIRDSTLTGMCFGDWVQACCEDVLDGNEAECPECGTVVHDGPCVGDEPEQDEAHAPDGAGASNSSEPI
jgi:hypothetical protein